MSHIFQDSLRNKPTEAEKVFYTLTKSLGLNLVFQKRFKRDNGLNYFIDFQFKLTFNQLSKLRMKKWPVKANKCINHRLLIEIDGEYHNFQTAYDFQREQEVLQRNNPIKYHFIRWTNHRIMFDSQAVLKELYTICNTLWGIELQFDEVKSILYDNQIKPIKLYDF